MENIIRKITFNEINKLVIGFHWFFAATLALRCYNVASTSCINVATTLVTGLSESFISNKLTTSI